MLKNLGVKDHGICYLLSNNSEKRKRERGVEEEREEANVAII